VKTFLANSVFLRHVADRFRANNGNCQYTILVKASSRKRVAELLDVTARQLREYHGIMEVGTSHQGIALEDEVIYFNPEHTVEGYINQWLPYRPPNTK
jgi:hypothetical protein